MFGVGLVADRSWVVGVARLCGKEVDYVETPSPWVSLPCTPDVALGEGEKTKRAPTRGQSITQAASRPRIIYTWQVCITDGAGSFVVHLDEAVGLALL